MIGEYLSQTNESDTVSEAKFFCKLNKALAQAFLHSSRQQSRVTSRTSHERRVGCGRSQSPTRTRPAEEEPPHRRRRPAHAHADRSLGAGLRTPASGLPRADRDYASLRSGPWLPVSLDPRRSPHRRPSASLALPDAVGGRPALDKWTAPPCTLQLPPWWVDFFLPDVD